MDLDLALQVRNSFASLNVECCAPDDRRTVDVREASPPCSSMRDEFLQQFVAAVSRSR
jgi:hypothetical protein